MSVSKIETPKTKNIVKIYQDDLGRNVIEDWEHGNTIVHNTDYFLGAKSVGSSFDDVIGEIMNDLLEDYDEDKDFYDKLPPFQTRKDEIGLLEKYLSRYTIFQPLYLYVHSGATVANYPFNCRFDSGQVGYIYIKKEDVREEYKCKRISKNLREKINSRLTGFTETLDNVLQGRVYGFATFEDVPEEDVDDLDLMDSIDSCWGFIGEDVSGVFEYLDSEKFTKEQVKEAFENIVYER